MNSEYRQGRPPSFPWRHTYAVFQSNYPASRSYWQIPGSVRGSTVISEREPNALEELIPATGELVPRKRRDGHDELAAERHSIRRRRNRVLHGSFERDGDCH